MILNINWMCRHTWKVASINTSWCLLGCSIGDFGTIAYFQFMEINWPVWAIMCLAILNGLITSIALETIILVETDGFEFSIQNSNWHVINIYDCYGGCNEHY